MGLSKRAIEEFKKIYSQEIEENISDEKAKELGENLLELFKIIYHPIPKKEKREKRCP
jgi:hypothetical protein